MLKNCFTRTKVDVVIIDIFPDGVQGIIFAETMNVIPMDQSHSCFDQFK
jgi:hypothetical protein